MHGLSVENIFTAYKFIGNFSTELKNFGEKLLYRKYLPPTPVILKNIFR